MVFLSFGFVVVAAVGQPNKVVTILVEDLVVSSAAGQANEA